MVKIFRVKNSLLHFIFMGQATWLFIVVLITRHRQISCFYFLFFGSSYPRKFVRLVHIDLSLLLMGEAQSVLGFHLGVHTCSKWMHLGVCTCRCEELPTVDQNGSVMRELG